MGASVLPPYPLKGGNQLSVSSWLNRLPNSERDVQVSDRACQSLGGGQGTTEAEGSTQLVNKNPFTISKLSNQHILLFAHSAYLRPACYSKMLSARQM